MDRNWLIWPVWAFFRTISAFLGKVWTVWTNYGLFWLSMDYLDYLWTILTIYGLFGLFGLSLKIVEVFDKTLVKTWNFGFLRINNSLFFMTFSAKISAIFLRISQKKVFDDFSNQAEFIVSKFCMTENNNRIKKKLIHIFCLPIA